MIISLLPVLPPDLRPIISNARGYITGDINLHYQNIVYRNSMIERLSNVFWIPKKLVSLKELYEQFNFPLKQQFNTWNIQDEFSISTSHPFIKNSTRVFGLPNITNTIQKTYSSSNGKPFGEESYSGPL